MPTKLPGVFALVKKGFDTYKSHFGVMFSIALIEVVLYGVLTLIMTTVGFTGTKADLHNLSGGAWATLIVSGIVYFVLVSLTSFALLHAIRGAEEKIGVSEAFQRASRQFLALITIMLITITSYFALVALFGVVTVLVFTVLGLGTLGAILGTVLLIVSVVAFATYTSLVNFVVIDDAGRGVGAFMRSFELVHGRFWQFLGRLAGTVFVLGILLWVVSLLVGFIAGLITTAVHTVIAQTAADFVGQTFSTLLFTPVLMATFYALYDAVKSAGAIEPASHKVRTWIKVLVAIGILTVLGVLIGGAILFTNPEWAPSGFFKNK